MTGAKKINNIFLRVGVNAMIKAILFDFDGVLTIDKTGSATITNYLSKATGLSLDLIKHHYKKYNDKLLLGEITHQDMWPSFCQEIGTAIPYELLIDSFKATALDKEMISYLHILQKTYRLAMITDNKADRMETILSHYALYSLFDVVAVSGQLHTSKKDSAIFQYTIDTLGVKPSECVFIDNTASNLIRPQTLGITTILFDDEHRDINAFKQKLEALID